MDTLTFHVPSDWRFRILTKLPCSGGFAPVMPTYARVDLVFERGEGPYLFTTDGERYLDFGCGIAVTSLGHAHPHLVDALNGQAERLAAPSFANDGNRHG